MFLHGIGVLVHEQEQGHGPHVAADTSELLGDVWVGSVKEEGVHVDDVLVEREVTEDLVLILELDTSLGHQREKIS